jgi:hypothetical protein
MSSQSAFALNVCVWSACAAVDGEDGEGGRGVDSVTLLVLTLVVVARVLQ